MPELSALRNFSFIQFSLRGDQSCLSTLFFLLLIKQIWKMTKYNSISFSGPRLRHHSTELMKAKYEFMCCVQSSETSAEEEKLVYSFRPQTPQLDNISDINNHNSWSNCLPLPTPEEKMKQQAQSVTTDIVPINITGTEFQCNIFKTFLQIIKVCIYYML